MIRRPPRSTRTHTLSLHDALPISSALARFVAPKSTRTPSSVASTSWPNTRKDARRAAAVMRVQWAASAAATRSEEHTSELQSLMRTSYAVLCLKKKPTIVIGQDTHHNTTKNQQTDTL